MSAKIKSACDHLVSIPQYGKVNSLNAAIACGILTYEARRQARNEGGSISTAASAESGDQDSGADPTAAEVL